jgi:hypothetical protein
MIWSGLAAELTGEDDMAVIETFCSSYGVSVVDVMAKLQTHWHRSDAVN